MAKKRRPTDLQGRCWYCYAVKVDLCPMCKTTEAQRAETAAFYASFKTIKVKR